MLKLFTKKGEKVFYTIVYLLFLPVATPFPPNPPKDRGNKAVSLSVVTLLILLFFPHISHADCKGCCSRHGGVCCVNGVTQCCDGTPLSSTCQAKGCNVCSPSGSGGSGGSAPPSQTIKIRLYGIDCPELSQSYGQEAKQFTENLALSKEVTIEKKDTDIYGRVVGIVYLPDGTLLNEELVKNGYAWVYDAYCTDSICSKWKTLEQQARQQKLGLWQDPNPIPPWDYRAQGVLVAGTAVQMSGYVTKVYDGDTIEVETISTSGNSTKGGCVSASPHLAYTGLVLIVAVKLYRRTKHG